MFSGARLRLLAWDADYSGELALEGAEEEVDEGIDLSTEQPAGSWQAIMPLAAPRPASTVFVDGVRRIDVRLVGSRPDRIFHGIFGSYAVGTTILEPGTARFGRRVVRRLVVLGSGESLPHAVHVGPALDFEPLSTPDTEPDAPLRALQRDMRRAEEQLAGNAVTESDALVIVDGPLTFESQHGDRVVGYVKGIHDLHLPGDHLPFLASLPPSSRTPLFALPGRRFARFSWFVRLAEPPAGSADLFGLARLEVVASVGIDAARALADATTALLPLLAPPRGRDPRSPQNLLPIGGLEAHLRQWLGDRRVVRSQIERAVVREAMHAGET